MVDPSLTISISRSSLPGSLSPLLATATRVDEVTLGIFRFQEPARQRRIQYAPEGFADGAQALSSYIQQAMLPFSLFPLVADEDAADELFEELDQALGQFAFDLTTTKNGGTPKVWACDSGSIVPAGERTLVDLRRSVPVWDISIPCFPIPS